MLYTHFRYPLFVSFSSFLILFLSALASSVSHFFFSLFRSNLCPLFYSFLTLSLYHHFLRYTIPWVHRCLIRPSFSTLSNRPFRVSIHLFSFLVFFSEVFASSLICLPLWCAYFFVPFRSFSILIVSSTFSRLLILFASSIIWSFSFFLLSFSYSAKPIFLFRLLILFLFRIFSFGLFLTWVQSLPFLSFVVLIIRPHFFLFYFLDFFAILLMCCRCHWVVKFSVQSCDLLSLYCRSLFLVSECPLLHVSFHFPSRN